MDAGWPDSAKASDCNTPTVKITSAALKGAPHPDNAKLFLDFAVSYDVQQLLQSDFYRRPVRSDVSPASKLPELSAIRQVAYDVSWASEHREAILMSWAFYLGTEAEQ